MPRRKRQTRYGDLDAITDGIVIATGVTFTQVWLNTGEPVDPLSCVAVNVSSSVVTEASGAFTLVANLSAVSNRDVVIDLGFSGSAVLGTDFAVSTTRIVVPAGSLTGNVTITALQDTIDEPDETVVIEFIDVRNAKPLGQQQVTVTIQDDDEALGFVVTSLTPTPSGFVAEFSANVDASTLNVFDTQTAVLGAADVFLTGATSGPLPGSVVVDAGLRQLTFIKSGGLLAADSYAVRLRSGLDGFRDRRGLLLDGDNDGIGGDDFHGVFTVAEQVGNPVVVSLPDFARGPGQDANLPANTTAGIPLSISRGAGMRNAHISGDYDPTLLTISGATAGPAMPAGTTIVLDTPTPGTTIATFTSPSVPAGMLTAHLAARSLPQHRDVVNPASLAATLPTTSHGGFSALSNLFPPAVDRTMTELDRWISERERLLSVEEAVDELSVSLLSFRLQDNSSDSLG